MVIRRRRVDAAEKTAPPPPVYEKNDEEERAYFADFTQPSPAKSWWWHRALANVNGRYELWKLDTERRLEPLLERVYKTRRYIARGAGACLLAGVLIVVLVIRYASNPQAYVTEVVRPTYARHGRNGVTLREAASQLSCKEITSGLVVQRLRAREEASLARVREATTTLILADSLPCMCAPMVRSFRRLLVVRGANNTFEYMYNAAIDAEWDGTLADGSRLEVSDRLVDEDQHQLFPDDAMGVSSVSVVRRSAVRVTYVDGNCLSSALVLQSAVGYCAQACADLLEGRSVYDVAEPRQ
jgi:hypothetical protein